MQTTGSFGFGFCFRLFREFGVKGLQGLEFDRALIRGAEGCSRFRTQDNMGQDTPAYRTSGVEGLGFGAGVTGVGFRA